MGGTQILKKKLTYEQFDLSFVVAEETSCHKSKTLRTGTTKIKKRCIQGFVPPVRSLHTVCWEYFTKILPKCAAFVAVISKSCFYYIIMFFLEIQI